MEVPDVQKAVSYLGAVVLRVESGCTLVLVLLVDAKHFIGYAVLEEYVMLEDFYCFLEGVYLCPQAVIFRS